nr:MAG TPA: portal protein [Caudoviricetes sp.]
MGIIRNLINRLRQGGAALGVIQSLNKVTDHPKIAINSKEYDRIADNLVYYEGEFPKVKYRNTYGQKCTRPFNSLNVAKVSVRRLASIIFNEQMKFEIKENEAANDFVHDTLTNNGFFKNFEEYLESCLALGGLAMRPYYDGEKIDISYIQAPVFYPLQSNTNDVSEAAIVSVTTHAKGDKQYYYTLIEFHEWEGDTYVITNELYESTEKNVVGTKVALGTIYEDLQERVSITGLSRPLFIYLKPFSKNNKDITSPLGLSIYDNAKNTMNLLNEIYDKFKWEFKIGQARIGVTDDMLTTKLDENDNVIQYFDTDQNIFVNMGDKQDGGAVGNLTVPIRAEDFIAGMTSSLKVFEMEIGLSSGTFSFDSQGLKTATEIVSENSMTYQTRNSHLSNVERAIKELIISILELAKGIVVESGKNLYSGEIPDFEDIILNFDDGVFLDKTAQLDYWTKAAAAGFVSKQYVMKEALDLSDEQIETILEQIREEQRPQFNGLDAQIYGGE